MSNNLFLIDTKDSNSFSFNLLISGIKINYNKNNLIKDNSSSSTIKSSVKVNNENNIVRKYSTLVSRKNNLIIRKFSSSSRSFGVTNK
jgi:hypothetical protein